MIDLATLTPKVIINMGLKDLNLDDDFKNKISSNINSAVLEMRAAGVLDTVIESEMGVSAIAIVCNDLLNIDSGNVNISKAYMYHLPILQALTVEDLDLTITPADETV